MRNSNIPKDLPNFIEASIDVEKVRRECKKLVKSRAKISAGVAIIPVPFLDIAVDAGMLSSILPEITARFGLISNPDDLSKLDSKEERQTDIKNRIFTFAGLVAKRGVVKQTVQGFGGKLIAKQIGKFIPFGGQAVSASLGYMIFNKVGNQHIDECYEIVQRIKKSSAA